MLEAAGRERDPGPGRRGLVDAWRSAVFAPVGDGRRRRRGSDAVALGLALLALLCCLLIIRYNSRIDRAVTQVIHPPPRSITWLVTVTEELGSLGLAAALAAAALLARRWVAARDLALSAAVTTAMGTAMLSTGNVST